MRIQFITQLLNAFLQKLFYGISAQKKLFNRVLKEPKRKSHFQNNKLKGQKSKRV